MTSRTQVSTHPCSNVPPNSFNLDFYYFMTAQLNDSATQKLSDEEYRNGKMYRTYGNERNTYTGNLPDSERATLDYILYKSSSDKVEVKVNDFQ